MTHNQASRERGFTLLELMIVVVIVGILAALATYGVRKYILQAKTLEGREVISGIMAGQEAYFDERFQYLDVSGGMNFYPESPATMDGTIKYQWGGNASCTTCIDNFNRLGVSVSQPVAFRYISRAGPAADASVASPTGIPTDPFAGIDPDGPYYTVFAASDLDGDGSQFTWFVGSSFQAQILDYNSGE